MKREHQLRLRSLVAAAVALLALVATPAAQARKPHSLHGVTVHLHSADRATARLASQPTGPLAAMYLAQAQAQTALSAQLAHAIVADARGKAQVERAATALGLLADHQTSAAQTLTSLLSSVRPELQAAIAQAISAATGGRAGVLATLGGLLPKLSASARPVVAQVDAVESSQGAQVPAQLALALGTNALVACPATGAVQQALAVATQAFQLGLANLGPVLGLVPPHVQAQVQSEIDGIPALLANVKTQLAQVVPCTPSAAGATPVAAVAAPTLLGGMTQLIDGILGRLLPGITAGQTSSPVAAPGLLSTLLAPINAFLGGH